MEIYTRVKISKTNKILIILLVLLPIINQYAIGPFTFLELFSFVVFVREVIVRKELEIKGLLGLYRVCSVNNNSGSFFILVLYKMLE
mgnify:CR=1 FL=1